MSGCTPDRIRTARTFLFVPGNRPDRFPKAAAAGSDVVIVDLEDSVSPAEKDSARSHARQWLMDGRPAVVRINGIGTPWHHNDLELLAQLPAVAVMLPKSERPEDITNALGGRVVVALLETATGISSAAAVAALSDVHRLAFGSVDLAAQLGVDPADREALLFARTSVVLTSAAAGLAPPVDGVTTAVADAEATFADTRYARSLGMTAKLCIHPAQVPAVHRALAPTSDEIRWARAIVDMADPAGSATTVDGQMVDLPVLTRAKSILTTADGAQFRGRSRELR